MEIIEPESNPNCPSPQNVSPPSDQAKHQSNTSSSVPAVLLGMLLGGAAGFAAVFSVDLIGSRHLLPEVRWTYTKGCIAEIIIGIFLGGIAVGFLKVMDLLTRKRPATSVCPGASNVIDGNRSSYSFQWSFVGWFIAIFFLWTFLNLPRGPGGLKDFLYTAAGFPWTFAYWSYDELSWTNPVAFFGDLFFGISLASIIAAICAWSRMRRRKTQRSI